MLLPAILNPLLKAVSFAVAAVTLTVFLYFGIVFVALNRKFYLLDLLLLRVRLFLAERKRLLFLRSLNFVLINEVRIPFPVCIISYYL